MRYLVLAAGMGKRLGDALGGRPKCLIDLDGETLIGRLLRQIRAHDPDPDIHVVLGYRSDQVATQVGGCRIHLNPFFDITGINASLWFARSAFDAPTMIVHGDVVLSEELAAALFTASPASLVAYDSGIRDDREINVAVADGTITRFGVNFVGYSGAYAGIVKLGAEPARLFADTLDRRIRRGFNEPRTYYFFVMRRLIVDHAVRFAAFDFAPYRWQEIDYAGDIAAARARIRTSAHGDAR
jgi:choline kinase